MQAHTTHRTDARALCRGQALNLCGTGCRPVSTGQEHWAESGEEPPSASALWPQGSCL